MKTPKLARAGPGSVRPLSPCGLGRVPLRPVTGALERTGEAPPRPGKTQEAHLGAEAEVVPEEVSCQASSFGSRTRLAGVRAQCCRVGAQPPPGSARPAEKGPCHHQAGRRRGPTRVRKSPECERRVFIKCQRAGRSSARGSLPSALRPLRVWVGSPASGFVQPVSNLSSGASRQKQLRGTESPCYEEGETHGRM